VLSVNCKGLLRSFVKRVKAGFPLHLADFAGFSTVRLYAPTEAATNGSYVYPVVTKHAAIT